MVKKANFYIGLENGLTHIVSCFDVKVISIHIGFPVEYCGSLSPFATTIAHKPFAPPESIPVEEVCEIFKISI